MKLLLALAVLSTSAVSFATDRAIYDIMYLPKAGTVYGISEGSFLDAKALDPAFGKIDSQIYTFQQSVGLSVTDRLLLSASGNYVKSKTDGTGFESESKGVSDPTITGRLRLMENSDLDVIGDVGISTGDEEIEDNGDSNNKQGGNVATLGLQYGNRSADFQWAVLGSYTRLFEATAKFDDGTSVENDAHGAFNLRGDLLSRIDEKSVFRSYLLATITDEYEDENDVKFSSSNLYTLGGEYQYLLSQNLMVRGGINYLLAKSNSVDQNDAFRFLVGANYQF